MKELVTVVIPVINPILTPLEEMALHHSLDVLKNHPVIFLSYEGADLSVIKEYWSHLDIIHFPERYFHSRKAFSSLLLMEEFYERFNWADYLLVHELNSWIVKDELNYWCNQGYDFLKAAPVFENEKSKASLTNPFSRIKGLSEEQKTVLGNSYDQNGFMLCYIERMYDMLKNNSKKAYKYRHTETLPNADALFWDLEPNRFIPKLRKPTEIVQNFFARHISNLGDPKSLKTSQLPFAITGITSIKGITSEIARELPYYP